jgi:TolA-binding protein
VKPQELIDGFVRLARASSDDSLSQAEQSGWQRLERTLARRSGRRPGFRVLGALALAAALCCAAVFLLRRDRALTFQVEHGRVSADGYIVCESSKATLRFSDESEVGMDGATRLRVSRVESTGAIMMLEGGLLDVHIHPRPKASWAIDAGPYVVRVTGTEFDLAWKVDEQTLDLRLRNGKVLVEGPLSGGSLRVVAGQRLVANAKDGSLSIVHEDATPPAAAASGVDEVAVASAPSPSPEPSAAPRSGEPLAAVRSAPEPPSWSARVAHGDFHGVVEDAERHGLERTLNDAPATDLAALASAARYARKQDLARRALVAERTRFPASIQARDAAFFLGGLAESEGDDAGALSWNETYGRESPNGAYAAQALGRTMVLVERLRGPAEARAVAAEYLQRFPGDPYVPTARRLLQSP